MRLFTETEVRILVAAAILLSALATVSVIYIGG